MKNKAIDWDRGLGSGKSDMLAFMGSKFFVSISVGLYRILSCRIWFSARSLDGSEQKRRIMKLVENRGPIYRAKVKWNWLSIGIRRKDSVDGLMELRYNDLTFTSSNLGSAIKEQIFMYMQLDCLVHINICGLVQKYIICRSRIWAWMSIEAKMNCKRGRFRDTNDGLWATCIMNLAGAMRGELASIEMPINSCMQFVSFIWIQSTANHRTKSATVLKIRGTESSVSSWMARQFRPNWCSNNGAETGCGTSVLLRTANS